MATYLLTWNPVRWLWRDLAAAARTRQAGKAVSKAWSSGNNKAIRRGDRVFLLKQGVPPRGVIASGWAASDVFEDTHWDPDKRKKKIPGRFVEVRFEVLLNPARQAPLEVQRFTRGVLSDIHWATQASGIRIPDRAAVALDRAWKEHLDALGLTDARAVSKAPHGKVREDEAEYSAGPGDEPGLLARITADVRIFGGKPIVRGRRLAVEHVLGLLAAGDTVETLLDNYPWLERADVQACLLYAKRLVAHERIEPLEVSTRS